MRFGTFVHPTSPELKDDYQVIQDALKEVKLAEELGLDAVWLPEHHFAGEVAFADPVEFAAAVAVSTQRVRIGFAVVEMALHHPVRLAVQTALLDNLSHGRLTVGTGRGSALNEYEYFGFGTSMEEGRLMLSEAEDLLVKAWTSQDVEHEGRFWKASFPVLRPRPYQKPHPPLARACISDESIVDMANIGRPILMSVQPLDALRYKLQLYRDTMLGAGYAEPQVERALDETWVMKCMYLTDSDGEAEETATRALKRYNDHQIHGRERYNPGGVPPWKPGQPPPPIQVVEHAFLAGSPEKVTSQIAALRDAGVRNLMLNINVGRMPSEQVERSLRLFAEKVRPQFASN